MVSSIVIFVIAIAVLLLILKVIGKSIKMLAGIAINAIVGFIVLSILQAVGLGVSINWASALIVGLLGIPGVLIVIALQLGMGWLIF